MRVWDCVRRASEEGAKLSEKPAGNHLCAYTRRRRQRHNCRANCKTGKRFPGARKRAENFMLSDWKMPIPERPGVYRADVMIDGVPVWRGFVRITG
jgi:hypothetical protein